MAGYDPTYDELMYHIGEIQRSDSVQNPKWKYPWSLFDCVRYIEYTAETAQG